MIQQNILVQLGLRMFIFLANTLFDMFVLFSLYANILHSRLKTCKYVQQFTHFNVGIFI